MSARLAARRRADQRRRRNHRISYGFMGALCAIAGGLLAALMLWLYGQPITYDSAAHANIGLGVIFTFSGVGLLVLAGGLDMIADAINGTC